MSESQNEGTEQDRQTLFVRGLTDKVDEEIIYELFQNVSFSLSFLKGIAKFLPWIL